MKRPPLCSRRGCGRTSRQAVGWGLSTGVVQYFCPDHFPGALARLAGLLRAVGLLP